MKLCSPGIAGAHVALARRHPELVQVLHDVRLPALDRWVVVHEELRRERGISLVFEALAEFLCEYAAE